jgi:hypothetical protein
LKLGSWETLANNNKKGRRDLQIDESQKLSRLGSVLCAVVWRVARRNGGGGGGDGGGDGGGASLWVMLLLQVAVVVVPSLWLWL